MAENIQVGGLSFDLKEGQGRNDQTRPNYRQALDNYTKTRQEFTENFQTAAGNQKRILKAGTQIYLPKMIQDLFKNNKALTTSASANFALNGQKVQSLLKEVQSAFASVDIEISQISNQNKKDFFDNLGGEEYARELVLIRDGFQKRLSELKKGESGVYYGQKIKGGQKLTEANVKDALTVKISNKMYYSNFERALQGRLAMSQENIARIQEIQRLVKEYSQCVQALRISAAQLLQDPNAIKNETQLKGFIKATEKMDTNSIIKLLVGHTKIGNERFGNAWGLIMEDIVAATVNAYLQCITKDSLEATALEALENELKRASSVKAFANKNSAIAATIRGISGSKLAQPLRDMTIQITMPDGEITEGASIKNYNFASQRGPIKTHKTLTSAFSGIGKKELNGLNETQRVYFLRILAATKGSDDDPSVPNYIGNKYIEQIWFGANMDNSRGEDYSKLVVINGVLMNAADYYAGVYPKASFDTKVSLSVGQRVAKSKFTAFAQEVISGSFRFESSWDSTTTFYKDLWSKIST